VSDEPTEPEQQPPARPAVPPPASAPEPTAAGGFNWGLRPGSAVVAPTVEPTIAPTPTPTPTPLPTPLPTPPPLPTPTPLVVPPVAARVLPPVEPPPTQPYIPEPTQPLSWDEFAASQQQTVLPTPSPLEQPTEAYTVQPWQPASALSSPGSPSSTAEYPDVLPGTPAPADAAAPTSAIDSLFGDHKFQDYEEVGVLATLQTLPTAEPTAPATTEKLPRGPLPASQKVLMGVAAGLIGVLILIALFFLGQHLGAAQAATPKPVKTGSVATPTPAGTGGPAAPGVQQWTALQGGECIQPFSSAWAQTFTVVACTADHDAEMVFKGKLPDSSSVAYPTAASFQKQLIGLCSAPTAINYGAAAAVTDLQVSFSYPPNTAAWLTGDRTYYCFVDRVSGGNLPGDLAVPKTSG
jgi:hypothetical protein